MSTPYVPKSSVGFVCTQVWKTYMELGRPDEAPLWA